MSIAQKDMQRAFVVFALGIALLVSPVFAGQARAQSNGVSIEALLAQIAQLSAQLNALQNDSANTSNNFVSNSGSGCSIHFH